jgi:hypothetical protein
LTCSDWELNTTENIAVTVQDTVNDSLLTYTTNIPNEISYKWVLNGSITLEDNDGIAQSSYEFNLLDSAWNIVYTWTIDDNNWNGTFEFSIVFDNLGLQTWTYKFQTESIVPVIGGENPQNPIVVSKDIEVKNYAPVWTTDTIRGNDIDDANETYAKFVVDLKDYIIDKDWDSVISIIDYETPKDFDGNQVDYGLYTFSIKNDTELYVETQDPDRNWDVKIFINLSDWVNPDQNTTVLMNFTSTY